MIRPQIQKSGYYLIVATIAVQILIPGCQKERRIIIQPSDYTRASEEASLQALYAFEKSDVQDLIIRGKYQQALTELNSQKDTGDITLWQKAYTSYKLRNYNSALKYLEEISSSASILEPYKGYLKILVYYDKEDYQDCLQKIKPISQFSEPILDNVYEIYYDCLIEEKKFEQAASVLRAFRDRCPDAISYNEYLYNSAYLKLKQGNKTSAYSDFLSLMKRFPSSYWGYKAGVALKNNKSNLTSTEVYYIALTSYKRKQWFEAIEYYDKYLGNASNQKYRYKSSLYRANSYYELGKFSKAIQEYKTLLAGGSFTEGLYRVGRCYHKLGDRKRALDYYKKVLSTDPRSNWAAWALWWQVEFAREDKKWKQAQEYCDKLFSTFPHHELGDNAAIWAGIAAYMNQDYSTAINRFQRILDKKRVFRSDKFRTTAQCWLSISKYQMGDASALDDFEKLSMEDDKCYYHYVGDKYLDRELPDPVATSNWKVNSNLNSAIEEAKTSLEEMGYSQRLLSFGTDGFRRARLLAQIGIIDWAEEEFSTWEKDYGSDPQTLLALMEYYTELGLTGKSFQKATQVNSFIRDSREEVPGSILRMDYPLFYYDEVCKQAESYGIDPLLILALIRRESAFATSALSYASAIGLMQIIPPTGKMIAGKLGEHYTDMNLYDYKTNIKYGSWYLDYLLDKYDNRIEYALAAYNAGEHNLERWLKIPHTPDKMEIFIENIDFQQTRHYVRNVMEDYYNYVRYWREED